MISSYISIIHELSFVLYESPFARYVFIFILYCKHTLFPISSPLCFIGSKFEIRFATSIYLAQPTADPSILTERFRTEGFFLPKTYKNTTKFYKK